VKLHRASAVHLSLIRPFVVVLLAGLMSWPVLRTFAQDQGIPVNGGRAGGAPQRSSLSANVSRYKLAVVDISAVFKWYKPFQSQVDQMKEDVKNAEAQLKQEQQGIAKLQKELRDFTPGSPDYKARDEKLAAQMAAFKLKVDRNRRDFMDREAKIYHVTYLTVEDEIKKYALHNDIGLVVRFNGEPLDPSKPPQRNEVLQNINKPVIFQNNIDITQDIIDLLNQRAQMASRPQVGHARPQ